eukprot:g44025.t1
MASSVGAKRKAPPAFSAQELVQMEKRMEELARMNKSQLIRRVLALELDRDIPDHLFPSMKHFNATKDKPPGTRADPAKRAKTEKKSRAIDWDAAPLRKVALRMLYLGRDYKGFSTQCEWEDGTVETQLFAALEKTRLVRPPTLRNLEAHQFSRCGRTDRGVSGLWQVVSLFVRSRIPKASDSSQPELSKGQLEEDLDDELDYPKILNAVLPKSIRVTAWAPVKPDFSARFSSNTRMYRYFFFRDGMDLVRMNRACKLLLGHHDFRNFCTMDVTTSTHFRRAILYCRVEPCDLELPSDSDDADEMCQLIVKANAFLYHQVRSIMAVLFAIGKWREEPALITELLNVEKYPGKPNYQVASDVPLMLAHCDYSEEVTWRFGKDSSTLASTFSDLHHQWRQEAMKAQLLKACMHSVAHDLLHFEAAAATSLSAASSASSSSPASQASLSDNQDAFVITEATPNEQLIRYVDTKRIRKLTLRLCGEQLELRHKKTPRYMPLCKRSVGKTYEELVAKLKGASRDKYQKTVQASQQYQEANWEKLHSLLPPDYLSFLLLAAAPLKG